MRAACCLQATSYQSWWQDVAATTRLTYRETFLGKHHHHYLQRQTFTSRLHILFRSTFSVQKVIRNLRGLEIGRLPVHWCLQLLLQVQYQWRKTQSDDDS